MARLLRLLKVSAVPFTLVSLALFAFCARVTVRNESGVALANVQLTGRSFVDSVTELTPEGEHTFWFIPRGDTGVKLVFQAGGRSIDSGSHGYFQAPPHPQIPRTVVITSALSASMIR